MDELLQKINARLQHYNHFTRPDPAAALQTDLAVIKRQLFTALGSLQGRTAERA